MNLAKKIIFLLFFLMTLSQVAEHRFSFIGNNLSVIENNDYEQVLNSCFASESDYGEDQINLTNLYPNPYYLGTGQKIFITPYQITSLHTITIWQPPEIS